MRNPEATRKLIIDKSLALFNTQGYQTTSLSDITEATGMTKGAIYANFSNKEDVASAAFDRAVEIVLGRVRECIREAPTAPLKLRAILQYYEKYVLNPPIPGGCPVLNSAVEADDNNPLLRTKVVRLITKIKDSLRQIVHRGILEKQLHEDLDADAFIMLYYGAIEGAIMVSRVEGDRDSFVDMSRFLTQLIDQYSL
ncbi:TetR/AcrR family transcriptional regulator [Tunicatimonas pelagia]|uniref:TetR/AcrR family transcriptional regulator n=1 Tax=Tunicatimonas pelagia TaxID=931531 RepID=UPI0026655060|nr:TetR/AcrR family transcriptional regulator [Tunicatimonas pelagia]WKN45877.1 TetR/AcrR family transcriptional regulator [Tunicatimonas pelagia]